ncbi:hypothetical protein CPC08DRAFT_720513 [Agrocybe pediades]|nr:hypothetical protein CPC08DRAFT_720513 [Agrocybe pediades]
MSFSNSINVEEDYGSYEIPVSVIPDHQIDVLCEYPTGEPDGAFLYPPMSPMYRDTRRSNTPDSFSDDSNSSYMPSPGSPGVASDFDPSSSEIVHGLQGMGMEGTYGYLPLLTYQSPQLGSPSPSYYAPSSPCSSFSEDHPTVCTNPFNQCDAHSHIGAFDLEAPVELTNSHFMPPPLFPCSPYAGDFSFVSRQSPGQCESSDYRPNLSVPEYPAESICSPSLSSDNPDKKNIGDLINDVIQDTQFKDAAAIQDLAKQDISAKVGGVSIKKLFNKEPKDRVCSSASIKAAQKRRKKPARFACPFQGCAADFTRNAGLQSHYKSHLGITDLECPFCGNTMATSLDRHKKRCKKNPNREGGAVRNQRKKRRDAVVQGKV